MGETQTRELPVEEVHITRQYRVTGRVRLDGAPVNWNARAIVWHSSDWRAPIRRVISLASWRVRGTRSRSLRYRLHLWLFRLTDNRQRTHYTPTVRTLRRLLNTQADVEARDAWSVANSYWRAQERGGTVND